MKEQYLNILQDLDYEVVDHGRYAKFAAKWRDGRDVNSVTLYYDEGILNDHVTGDKLGFKKWLSIIKNIGEKDVEDYLGKKNFILIDKKTSPTIKMIKKYDVKMLESLIKDGSYWQRRGISEETLDIFGGGVSRLGNSKDRYLFPIWNEQKEIVGFAGRDLTGTKEAKWKLFGMKGEWEYPLFYSKNHIQAKREIIICESLGDALSLIECGINNVFIIFGLECLKAINVSIRLGVERVVIATNNDFTKDYNAGAVAAEKIRDRFCKYFPAKNIVIALPPKHNDLNELLTKDGKAGIIDWYSKIK